MLMSLFYNPNGPSPQQFIDSVNRKSLSTIMSAVFNIASKQGHCVTVQGYMTATLMGGSTPSYFFCIFRLVFQCSLDKLPIQILSLP